MDNKGNNKDNNENIDESNKQNNEINNPTINQGITILMNLYIFNNDLHNNVKESIITNDKKTFHKGEYYLIRDDCFSYFINFFLYEDAYQTIKNDERDPISYKTKIIDKLKKNYQKILHEKINNSKEIPNLIDENIYKVEYELNQSKTEMIFIYKYSLLNKDILNIIFQNQHKSVNIKLPNYLNNKKIIIKHEEKKALLIGTLSEDDMSNIFIPEIILEYDNINQLQTQFSYFEKNDYNTFEQTLALKEKITDLKHEEKIIGKAYLIDKEKYNNLDKYNENILSSLYNNYELINKKIKEPFGKDSKKEKFFIINYNYIKKLKELFKFNDLLETVSKKDFINELFIKEKNYLKKYYIKLEKTI